MSDHGQLVEQARDYAVFYGENRSNADLVHVLAGLADAVEQLQVDLNEANVEHSREVGVLLRERDELVRRLDDQTERLDRHRARLGASEAERDAACARVADLEAGIREHSCGISHGCDCWGDHHDPENSACRFGQPFEQERRLLALLDSEGADHE